MEQILIDDSYVDSDLINLKGQKYPRIVIEDNQIVKPSMAPEHLADVFLVDNTNFCRRLFQQYRSKGFVSMLNFIKDTYMMQQSLTDNDKEQSTPKPKNYGLLILYSLSIIILYIRFLYLTVHYYFYPFDKYSDDELLQQFNPNPDWKSGILRSFVWHPNSLRCALALINDLIYVYTADDCRPINHIVCLKNVQQKRISSMCWHPKHDNILVVACQQKILIWSLKSDLSKLKLEGQKCLQVIDSLIQSPITSIVFNEKGDKLIACSPRNSSLSMIRFDETKMKNVELIRNFFIPQFTSLLWSPDQSRLFAQTTTKKLCIFETINWTYKFWSTPKDDGDGICQTSVWSKPNGRILLFSCKNSSKIYALTFYDRAEAGDVGGNHNNQAIMVLDTSQNLINQDNSDADQNFQCLIHQICWDTKSTRLAVSFKDRLDLIAIYATQLNPGLKIQPLCLLKSNFTQSSLAQCLLLSFHDNFFDPGSLLTICWSNGYLTHIPLLKDNFSNYYHHCQKNGIKSSPDPKLESSTIRSLTSLCYSFEDQSILNEQSSIIANNNHSITKSPMNGSLINNGIDNTNGVLKNRKNINHAESLSTPTTDRPRSKLTATTTPLASISPFTPRRTTLYSMRAKFD